MIASCLLMWDITGRSMSGYSYSHGAVPWRTWVQWFVPSSERYLSLMSNHSGYPQRIVISIYRWGWTVNVNTHTGNVSPFQECLQFAVFCPTPQKKKQ